MGSPISKYEHRRALALLHSIRNVRICRETTYHFSNHKKKDFSKKHCTLHKMCVSSLVSDIRAIYTRKNKTRLK